MRQLIGAASVLLALLPRAGSASFLLDVSAPGDAGAGVLSILPSSPTGALLDLSPSATQPAAPAPPAFDPGGSPVVVQAGQKVNASQLPATFSSLQVQSGAVLVVDGDLNLPATGTVHDVRIAGTVQFIPHSTNVLSLGIVSDVIVVEPSARVAIDAGHFLEFHGQQVFLQGRIAGGDSSTVRAFTSSPGGELVVGGRIIVGAESLIDFSSADGLFLTGGSDLRLGPDGEVDAGAPTVVVMAGKIRGRGKPLVGAGTQLFIRTQQLVGPGGKMKARGEFAEVLLGVTDGKHWDSARFVGTIDVRATNGGSVEIAGETLEVDGSIDASGTDTGGTIAFDSMATPVLPPCKNLRVSGGSADGSVTENGAPICP
jgi:hypothetical protein